MSPTSPTVDSDLKAARNIQPASAPLRLFLALLVGLWIASGLPLLLHAHWWPARFFLWYPPPFYDFGCYYERLQMVHTPAFWTFQAPGIAAWDYPAPCIFVYKLFYAFNRGHGGPHRVFFGFLSYLCFTGTVLLISGALFARALYRRGLGPVFALAFAACSLLLCWPVYFSMQRGNIEFFLDAGVSLGVYAYIRRHWAWAAVLIGIFGAGKLYPLLLLLLLLPLRKWKEFAWGCAVAAGVTELASAWIGRPVATAAKGSGVMAGILDWFHANSLTFDYQRSAYDHSLFGFLKLLLHAHPAQFGALSLGLSAAIAVLGVAVAVRVWQWPRPNQLLAVLTCAVLFPPSSFDYTLSLLLPVWGWMALLSLQGRMSRPSASLAHALFAALFAPEAFLAWHGAVFGGQLKMVCLLGLLSLACAVPLGEAEPGEEAQGRPAQRTIQAEAEMSRPPSPRATPNRT